MNKLGYIFSCLLMAILGFMMVRNETVSQEIITSIVLIVISVIAIAFSLRWLHSER